MVLEHKKESNNCFNVNHLSPKSKKMKKVPQRGMGVAQLEKIRIEEQQQQKNKNNSTTISASSTTSSAAPLLPTVTHPFPFPLKPKQPSSPFSSPLYQSPVDLFQPSSASASAFDSGSTMDTSNPIERFSTSRFVSQAYNPNITLAKAKSTVLQPSCLSSGVVHLQEPPSNQIYHSSNIFSRTEEGTNPWSSTSATTVFDPLSLSNFTITHPYLLKPPDEAMLIMHANDSMNFESSFRERASTSGATHQVDMRNSDICTNGKVDWRKKLLSGNSSSSMDAGHISLAQSASRAIQHHRELHDFMPSSGYGTEDSQQRFFNFIPVPPPPTAREPANDDSQQRFFNFIPPPLEPVDTTLTLREPEALDDVDTKLKL